MILIYPTKNCKGVTTDIPSPDIREMVDYDHMIAEEPANNSLIDTAIEVIRDVQQYCN